jgi:ADP-ribose pyrophosphatase YjhB (NUDIX family)
MSEPVTDDVPVPAPTIPVSAGAMIFDRLGRLLVLEPTYKKGWTIPGGVMEANGETPWQACRREVFEECGLLVTSGRLAAVDTRPTRAGRAVQLRLLFDCGVLDDALLAGIRLCETEISAYQLLPPDEAFEVLRPAVGRRVRAALAAPGCCYLEDGLPVLGVTL